jgi:hypothetical protein
MTCVFRVSGQKLDVKAIINRTVLTPYRVEENLSETNYINCIYYDVFSDPVGLFEEAIPQITSFLHTNAGDLAIIAAERHVEKRTIDVMYDISDEDYFVKNILVGPKLMQELVRYNISLNVSLYRIPADWM